MALLRLRTILVPAHLLRVAAHRREAHARAGLCSDSVLLVLMLERRDGERVGDCLRLLQLNLQLLVLHLRLAAHLLRQVRVLQRLRYLRYLCLQLRDLVDKHLRHVHVEVGLLVGVDVLVSRRLRGTRLWDAVN